MRLSVMMTGLGLSWATAALAEPPTPTARGALVALEGGRFEMGVKLEDPGPYGQQWKVDEAPRHSVEVAPFEIHRAEVTVEMWAEFLTLVAGQMAWHPLQPVDFDGARFTPAVDPQTPITSVTWADARAFCRWHGLDLPSEAQWEYAARGEGGARFTWPWGEDSPNCTRAHIVSGPARCHEGPWPVGEAGERGETRQGLADMVGNVGEWVLDAYLPYDAEQSDPVHFGEGVHGVGHYRVARGGGWLSPQHRSRVTARTAMPPEGRSVEVGFRCATPEVTP